MNTHISYTTKYLSTVLCILFILISCNKGDDAINSTAQETVEQTEETTNPKANLEETEEEADNLNLLGLVEVLNPNKVDSNYILVNNAGTNKVLLMDKQAQLIHEWNTSRNIGNDVFLLNNGKLLGSMESDEPVINLGGQGGHLQIIAVDGTIEWEFIYSSLNGQTHHDAEMLPNGNILAMVWQKFSAEYSLQAGFMLDESTFLEAIIEVNPSSNEIVWEWHSKDHLIQDFDATKDNFGSVANNPQLIDLNYVIKAETTADIKGDIMHANGISYDQINDLIFLSVNFYSEVWVIDHSTTTIEAAGHTGGNYGKGGDLIYRFGNPDAYMNTKGNRLFHNNHYPNLLSGANTGKMLIFSNGNNVGQSTVFEIELPSTYELMSNTNNEPRVSWSFTDPNLYSPRVSGAVLLPNGNILITEGDFGFWEVTRDKEVVWKFSGEGFFWRGYSYGANDPGIIALDLP